MEIIKLDSKITQVEITPTYGKFIAEPLPRGYGVTIGNALRRVLLSSIEGYSITSAKIDGVLHEFATIPGVLEDVSEIILNLKGIRFKLVGSGKETVVLDRQGIGEVCARDIKESSNVKIMNPEHYIASLTEKKAKLFIEMVVEKGKGYIPAERMGREYEIGVIPIDAIFSPVQKVNYIVENTRVGQITDFNKLTIEIWTDGSVTPDKAVEDAAKDLIKHFDFFATFSNKEGEEKEITLQGLKAKSTEKILSTPVNILGLTNRTQKCLSKGDINTIGDLVEMTKEDILNIKNFGKACLTEVEEKLKELNLSLKET
jgi:DNA-directed RNA polymerase subunit alpha